MLRKLAEVTAGMLPQPDSSSILQDLVKNTPYGKDSGRLLSPGKEWQMGAAKTSLRPCDVVKGLQDGPPG